MDVTDAILARFQTLHPREIDLSLGRMHRLLAQLGHPERNLPPVVHVAGTNGKGSTIAFMRAMLEADGASVHVYTSPHLVRFHERFRLGAPGGGRFVDESVLAEILTEVEQVNADQEITLFEITTAAAFVLFARYPADYLLLEVGLGGRLDATNVIDRPALSVITPVSVDHTKFLGETVEEIAIEKAGVLKPGVRAVIAGQTDSVRDVIEASAARVGADLLISGQDWQAREERGRLVFEDGDGLLDLPLPRLRGRHQHENAGTAIAALRALPGVRIPATAIEAGLQNVDWPARMQRLTLGRLFDILPAESELWLDGGHNPEGARVVSAAIGELEERVARPLVLVVAMLNTKDSDGFLESFRGIAAHVHGVAIAGNENSRSAEEVAKTAVRAGIAATAHASLEEAVLAAGRHPGALAPRVLITGSLYLAGEVLAANETPPA